MYSISTDPSKVPLIRGPSRRHWSDLKSELGHSGSIIPGLNDKNGNFKWQNIKVNQGFVQSKLNYSDN